MQNHSNIDRDDVLAVLEFMVIMNSGDSVLLNEERSQSIKALFSKISNKLGTSSGGKPSRSGRKNILALLGSISKNAALALIYAMQAQLGKNKEESKQKLKKILSTTNLKAEFVDFIIRADVLTLHMISSPIHIIDALTGYELGDLVREKATGEGRNKLVAAIDFIAKFALQKQGSIINKTSAKKIRKNLNSIRRIFLLKDDSKGVA